MRVFQRACVRAGMKVAYSQGFNPHLRMSLVLPRSVGVESDDEILCLWLEQGQEQVDGELLKSELPQGIEIVSAQISRANSVPEPVLARYVIKVKCVDESIKGRSEKLLASDKIVLERRSGEGSKVKMVDVRPFLESIGAESREVVVDCKISPAGTIRVDEILDLLKLTVGDLAGSVRRTSVQWQSSPAGGF
jgi:radical SAM-linked protein